MKEEKYVAFKDDEPMFKRGKQLVIFRGLDSVGVEKFVTNREGADQLVNSCDVDVFELVPFKPKNGK